MNSKIPSPLDSLWRNQRYGCTHLRVEGLTSLIVQAPRREVEGWRDIVVAARLEYHQMPTAPVVRMYVEFYDRPDAPFHLEAFFNVAEEEQDENLRLLSQQDELIFHFYAAEGQSYLYSKSVNWRNPQRRDARTIRRQAVQYHRRLKARYDFDTAKAAFQRQHPV